MSGGDGNSKISKSKKFLLPPAGGSWGVGGQSDGGPGARVTCRSWKHGGLSDGNWGHGGDAGAAGETFRNSERGDTPGLSLLPPPFVSRGRGCSLGDPSQKSAKPGARKH